MAGSKDIYTLIQAIKHFFSQSIIYNRDTDFDSNSPYRRYNTVDETVYDYLHLCERV